MNLDNLTQDIRHSIGDIKAEKFTPARLLLALRKTINKLNYKFHLNKKTEYIKVNNFKKTYTLPEDFYYLETSKYNGKDLKSLHYKDKDVNPIAESDNSVSYLVYNSAQYNKMNIQPIPNNIETAYKIVDASGLQLTVDFDKVTTVEYKDEDIYLIYGAEYTDFISNITEVDETYGLLEVNYIAEYNLLLTVTNIDIPFSFYDAIHFKVVADLLSDDNRTEVIQKSLKYEADYDTEISKMLIDDIENYVETDLLIDYRTGV